MVVNIRFGTLLKEKAPEVFVGAFRLDVRLKQEHLSDCLEFGFGRA